MEMKGGSEGCERCMVNNPTPALSVRPYRTPTRGLGPMPIDRRASPASARLGEMCSGQTKAACQAPCNTPAHLLPARPTADCSQVPLVVLPPQPQPTPEAPFYKERPPWWNPAVVEPPVGISVPSAPALPPELLKPGAGKGAAGSGGGGCQQGGWGPGRGPPEMPAGRVVRRVCRELRRLGRAGAGQKLLPRGWIGGSKPSSRAGRLWHTASRAPPPAGRQAHQPSCK